jgi:hypothetical protein
LHLHIVAILAHGVRMSASGFDNFPGPAILFGLRKIGDLES